MSFAYCGIEIRFEGEAINEKGIVVKCNDPKYQVPAGQVVVSVDERYYRPTEVDQLLGDASKAKKILGWEPSCSVNQLVGEMMESDLREMA